MTERLADITGRIESLHQLEAVVAAMRGIAASRAHQARALLPGVRAHAFVIGRAIGQALTLVPDEHTAASAEADRGVIILFCAEQGFVGPFSDRMLDAAGSASPGTDLFLIGTRGLIHAEARRLELAWHTPMVSHANLVPTLAGRIAEALYSWLPGRGGHRVEVIVPTSSPAGGVAAERRSLLPFDFARFAVGAGSQPPLTTLPAAVLLMRLAEEYVFAELCDAALAAFAAENEARVATMLAMKGNLEHMRSDLETLERQTRQEEITAEVVELASGARARAQIAVGSRSP